MLNVANLAMILYFMAIKQAIYLDIKHIIWQSKCFQLILIVRNKKFLLYCVRRH
jgi:hypothetical protein